MNKRKFIVWKRQVEAHHSCHQKCLPTYTIALYIYIYMKYFWHPCQVQSVHICLASFGQLHVYIPTSLNLKLVLAACNGDQQIMVSTASNKAMSQPHIYTCMGIFVWQKKGLIWKATSWRCKRCLNIFIICMFLYM